MADIKVKDIAKKSIKAIDKSAIATERFKDTIVHTKQKAENTYISKLINNLSAGILFNNK